ncbi:hypothetical protein ACH5RR_021133 [Cinchona calisaya]|uniref:Cystatin domain-containing protein n=1 Tax=Cinchona calisaya TaxID=153742 RepID=A0ABD2ZHF7_9GENT
MAEKLEEERLKRLEQFEEEEEELPSREPPTWYIDSPEEELEPDPEPELEANVNFQLEEDPGVVNEVDYDEEIWTKYIKEIEDSDGFDIQHFPGACLSAPIEPLQNFKDSPHEYRNLIELSKVAIDVFNKENRTEFEFYDVVTTNVSAGIYFKYYITFQAWNRNRNMDPTTSNEEPTLKPFQAEIHRLGITPDDIKVDFCRIKKDN